jgi:hypothetical protein
LPTRAGNVPRCAGNVIHLMRSFPEHVRATDLP